MAFNGSGNYVLPAGQPVVSGTTISSAIFNTYTADIANALDLCVTRDGQGSPSTTLKIVDGSLSNPGIAFNSESSTGIYRASAGVLTIVTLGVATASFSAAGVTGTSFVPTGSTVPTNGMYLSAANTLNFSTSSVNRIGLSSAGNVLVNPPTSGTALTVDGFAGSPVLTLASGNTTGTSDLGITRAGSTANAVASGPNVILIDTTNTTETCLQNSGGQTELWQFNGTWGQILNVNTNHGVTINTPLAGTALVVNGTTNNSTPGQTILSGISLAPNAVSTCLYLQQTGGAAYGGNGAALMLGAISNNSLSIPVAGVWATLVTGGTGGGATDHSGSLIFGTKGAGDAGGPAGRVSIDPAGNMVINNSLGVGTSSNNVPGDITCSRAGGTTGGIFFGTSGSRYLFWDGTNYNLPGASVVVGGNLSLAGAASVLSAASSFGSMAVTGVTGGWAGLQFPSSTSTQTFMVSANGTISSGSYSVAAATWNWRFDGGALAIGSVPYSSITATTTSNAQFNSLGIGTPGSGTAGEIRATNNITCFYSDMRLKDVVRPVTDALTKVESLSTFFFKGNQTAQDLGYDGNKVHIGVSAQEVQKILPEVIEEAPIDSQYMTLDYSKLVPLLIESTKELSALVKSLQAKIAILESR